MAPATTAGAKPLFSLISHWPQPQPPTSKCHKKHYSEQLSKVTADVAVGPAPATLTAFSSRLCMSPTDKSNNSSSSSNSNNNSGINTNTNPNQAMAAQQQRDQEHHESAERSDDGASGSSYASSSAISFYSDDDEYGDDEDATVIASDSSHESDWEDQDDGRGATTLEARPGAKHGDGHGPLVFRRVEVPRTRSLASNLSLLLREAKKLEKAAVQENEKKGQTEQREQRDTTTTPFDTGRTGLPNPLRCHPGVLTPPRTPSGTASQSPPAPPPAPPSSPYIATPPRSEASASSLASSASSSCASSSSLLRTASTPSSSSSSSSAAASSSDSASADVPASSTLSSRPPVFMRITQLPPTCHAPRPHSSTGVTAAAATASAVSSIDDGRQPPLPLPFNGACGPRAPPVVPLGRRCATHSRYVRSGSSLLPGEITSSLKQSIWGENNSRFVFKHYGSRRRVDVCAGGDDSVSVPSISSASSTSSASSATAPSPPPRSAMTPPFRRSQSAPNIQRPTLVPGYKLDPVLEIYYVDDYEDPKSWSWGMDYHSKGW